MARKIIYYLAVSADGYIARPDGAVDWLELKSLKGDHGMTAFYRSVDICLMGRKTYDVAVAFGMKDGYAGKRNVVASRTQKASPAAKVEFTKESPRKLATRLRTESRKDIWLVGGGELAGAFLDAGELDELQLHVIPVLIGDGIPIFGKKKRTAPMRLLKSRSYPDGVVHLRYQLRNR